MNALLICSGGLDSVVLAHELAAQNALGRLLSFDYGQRHKVELAHAARCAARLDVPHDVIDLTSVGAHLTGSALTDNLDVPDGHYAQDSMMVTIVPNRNAIMLTIAYGVAMAHQLDMVAIATHGGDHFIYPDCRPDFLKAFSHMQTLALEGCARIALHAPYQHESKAQIVAKGARLDVPFGETWSCYKGGARHCGRCGTCVERREAFHLARIGDPTDYVDPHYWRKAVADHPLEEQS